MQFDDGGIGYGSFIYDADTNSYSDLAIGTTAGSDLPGSFYAFVRESDSSANGVFLLEDPELIDGAHALWIRFADLLSNAGGSVEIHAPLGVEGPCAALNPPFEECDAVRRVRRLVGGRFVGTPLVTPAIATIPVPAAFWLYGSVLMLLAFARTRRP